MKLLTKSAIASALALAFGLQGAQAEEVKTTGGIQVKSDDGAYQFDFNGRLHFDMYAHQADNDSSNLDRLNFENGSFVRRLRMSAKTKLYTVWEGQLELDFPTGTNSNNVTGNNVNIQNAWLAYTGWKPLGGESAPFRLQIGQFKTPMGLEELTSSNYITFIERSMPINAVAPNFRRGAQVSSTYGNMTWAFMPYFDANRTDTTDSTVGANLGGAAAGVNDDTASSAGLGLGGRVTWTPIKDKLKLWHVGAAIAREDDVRAVAPATTRYDARNVPQIAMTPTSLLQNANVSEGEAAMRYGLESAFVYGPFSVQAEYLVADYETASPDTTGANNGGNPNNVDPKITGFYVFGSWFLTGESRPYRAGNGTFDRVKPLKKSGAWELALRYDFLESEYGIGAPPTAGPEETVENQVETYTFGVNYYVNPNIRFMLNLIAHDIDVQRANGTPSYEGTPKTIGFRTQFDF